jgi:hypothetical protein
VSFSSPTHDDRSSSRGISGARRCLRQETSLAATDMILIDGEMSRVPAADYALLQLERLA